MKKLYIWDFDGTLVDTITDVGLCFNEALNKCGYPTHSLELYNQFVGGNLETVVSRLLPPESNNVQSINKVKEAYRNIYSKSKKPNTMPFSKIKEVLSFLDNEGVYLAISTNKAQSLTEPLCERYFPDIPFISIMGYLPDRPSKPYPETIYQIMDIAGVSQKQTVYVGDGPTDVQTAENAGIDCIFVTWGQGKPGDERSNAVKFIAQRPEEIITYHKNNLG